MSQTNARCIHNTLSTVAWCAVWVFTLLGSTNVSAEQPANGIHPTVEIGTDFPVLVGAAVRVETEHRIRLSTGLGFMPTGYLDTIHAVSMGLDWYDELTANLISAALDNAVVWPTRVGWRPMENRGLYTQAGYQLVALGGGLSGVEVVSAVTGVELPPDTGPGREMDIAATVHMIHTEVGWEWSLSDQGRIRAGVGGAFTAGSNTVVAPTWTPRRRAQRAVDSLAVAGETYLDDIIQKYVHTLSLGIAVGWQL